ISGNRPQLVGLRSTDGNTIIPPGSHLATRPLAGGAQATQGYLTASVYSPTLDCPIALAFLDRGAARHGEHLWALSPLTKASVRVEVTTPHLYNPKGDRLRD
ncbi:MAG: sarcosine oxidase subunit alpha, partial [Rhodobacteraceae bacterium]|nr:sarcosine oxidase subunit alpha [Paracoccaceae bacterium]